MSGELGLTIKNKVWESVMRSLSLITLFIGAYTLVQSILVLLRNYGQQDVSVLVVVLYLLVTPFSFGAALMFAVGVHRMAQEKTGEQSIVWGFAMMVMAAIDNLIYASVRYEEDSVSIILLGGIELICVIIYFLYYQGMDHYALTVCAGFLLLGCAVLELKEVIQYFNSVNYYEFTGYYFAQTVLSALLALMSMLFVFALQKSIVYKRNIKKKK